MNSLYAISISKLTSYSGHNEQPISNESARQFSLSIKWQHTVDKYHHDLDTYIWKPYGSPPPFCYASLFITRNNTSCVPRALILFSTARSLRTFRQQHDLICEKFSRVRWPAMGLLHTVYAVYGVALKETNDFLQDVSLQVFNMVGPPYELCEQVMMSRRLDLSKSKASIKAKIPASSIPQ